jgi:hypothetical protein
VSLKVVVLCQRCVSNARGTHCAVSPQSVAPSEVSPTCVAPIVLCLLRVWHPLYCVFYVRGTIVLCLRLAWHPLCCLPYVRGTHCISYETCGTLRRVVTWVVYDVLKNRSAKQSQILRNVGNPSPNDTALHHRDLKLWCDNVKCPARCAFRSLMEIK